MMEGKQVVRKKKRSRRRERSASFMDVKSSSVIPREAENKFALVIISKATSAKVCLIVCSAANQSVINL
jgi:hypothetical protein